VNKKLGLLFMCGVLTVAAKPPQHSKYSEELDDVDPQSTVNVIVQYKQVPDEDEHQKVVRRGGAVLDKFKNIKEGSYSLPASAVANLANDPSVAYVSPDHPLRAKLDYTAAAVNASAAWAQGLDGTGIVVAVIDSGMNQSPDLALKNNIVYSQDFTGQIRQNGKTQDTKNAPDLYGHGQHVAGTIASTGKSSSCEDCTRVLKGIAPGVRLVNLRALNEKGEGTDSTVIAAIDEAIALKKSGAYNIRVLNLSLGRPVYESYTHDPLCQAVEQAWKSGIVVVVAAGNDGRDGYGTITAPGNDPYVITVGAMKTMGTYPRTDDRIASYSSKGPTAIDYVVKPDLVAPGNQVVSLLAAQSTLASQYPSNAVTASYYQEEAEDSNGKKSGPYFMMSGTSMATPVVSAAAADLLQAHPELTPDQVKARLMLTAYKTFPASSTATDPTTGQTFTAYYDVFTVGAGYLDLGAALTSNAMAPGTAMSPWAVADAGGNVYFVADSSSVWNVASSQGTFAVTSVWAPSAVGSTRSMWGLGAVSSSRSMWGLSTVGSSRSMWGLSTVDPSRSMWGLSIQLNESTQRTLHNGVAVPGSLAAASGPEAESVNVKGEN